MPFDTSCATRRLTSEVRTSSEIQILDLSVAVFTVGPKEINGFDPCGHRRYKYSKDRSIDGPWRDRSP